MSDDKELGEWYYCDPDTTRMLTRTDEQRQARAEVIAKLASRGIDGPDAESIANREMFGAFAELVMIERKILVNEAAKVADRGGLDEQIAATKAYTDYNKALEGLSALAVTPEFEVAEAVQGASHD